MNNAFLMQRSLFALLIAISFFACRNVIHVNDSPKVSTEILDTVKSISVKIVAQPVLFEAAFIKGTKEKVKDSVFSLYGVTIGHIKVMSGNLVVCDPLHIDEYGIPFTQGFPTGDFPVQLSIAKVGNEELTAFARVKFSDEPVERWEVALQKGQAPIPVGGAETYGYGVDGSAAIFIDEEASKVLDKKEVENFEGAVFKEMNNHYHNYWKYSMYNFNNYNLAIFSTGVGDGRYETYIGFDANKKPCRLLTDFGIFEWKK